MAAVGDFQRLGKAERCKPGANPTRIRMFAAERHQTNAAIGEPIARMRSGGPLDQRRNETRAGQMSVIGNREPPMEIAASHRSHAAEIDSTPRLDRVDVV